MDGIQQVSPVPCAAGCGFWGNATTQGLCSKCYREKRQQQQDAVGPAETPLVSPPAGSDGAAAAAAPVRQEDTTRCWKCKRNVGFTGVRCRCDFVFCGKHRHDYQHNCTFDYHGAAEEQLRKSNPTVFSPKVDKI